MRIWCQVLRVLRSICCSCSMLLSKMKKIRNLNYVLHSYGLIFPGLLDFCVYTFILCIFFILSGLWITGDCSVLACNSPVTKVTFNLFSNPPWVILAKFSQWKNSSEPRNRFPHSWERIRPLGQLIFLWRQLCHGPKASEVSFPRDLVLGCDSAGWYFPPSRHLFICFATKAASFSFCWYGVSVKNGWGKAPGGWEEACAVGKRGWEKGSGLE